MVSGTWWYCLEHHEVEPYEGCKSEQRLGPYPTPEAASEALKRAQARNTEWEEDPRFNDPKEDEDDESTGWGPFRA